MILEGIYESFAMSNILSQVAVNFLIITLAHLVNGDNVQCGRESNIRPSSRNFY